MPRLYSHPVVHPHPAVVAAPPAQWQVQGQQAAAPVQGEGANGDVNAPPGVIMRNRGKRCRPGMRLAQAAFAAAALAAMASTHGFASVTAFRTLIFTLISLIVAATVQCLWSLAVAIVDLYALLAKRTFRNARALSILALGDWVTGAMIFSAACGSAAITVLLDNDLRVCPGNHCPSFMTATAMAFLCWFVRVPSGIANLWGAVYKIQRS